VDESQQLCDPQIEHKLEAKVRLCLMCRKDFLSEWAGTRVCPKCKNSSAWRTGTEFNPGTYKNR